MTSSDNDLELLLQIGTPGADDAYLDSQTRRLLRELRAAGYDAQLAEAGNAPAGSKAVDAMAIASLVVPIVASAAPKLIELLIEWRTREKSRTLRVMTRREGVVVRIERYTEERSVIEVEE